MADYRGVSEIDRFDTKVFRETLGSFGTTTTPGADQLKELQKKVRQGVKHVELHLANSSKGQFNAQDVPDKYGFEQRRTIMQLAKLNQQSLSVHGTFNINSFSGLSQHGFDEMVRSNNIKEIDETLKFAAETAKSGAVVFHLHETAFSPPASELNLPKEYLKYLEKEKPEEYKRIMRDYLNPDSSKRIFQDNIYLETELKAKYGDNWKDKYETQRTEKIKFEQEGQPYVVVGDTITKVDRNQELIGLANLDLLDNQEKKLLERLNLPSNKNDYGFEDFQKLNSLFSNGKPDDINLSVTEFEKLKDKLFINYEKILKKNYLMKSEADKEFFKLTNQFSAEVLNLQKKEFSDLKNRYKEELEIINRVKLEEKKIFEEYKKESDSNKKNELKRKLDTYNRQYQMAIQNVGLLEYQKLEQADEQIAKINAHIKQINERSEQVSSATDEIFNRNSFSMAQLGLKALEYQLSLKEKSFIGETKRKEIENKISNLELEYNQATSLEKQDKLSSEIQKQKYELRKYVGLSDYSDIDVVNKPLYLAPENIMAGYGYMDSLEEYKAVIRTSWKNFAKLLLDNPEYKTLKEKYEKETGTKINSFEAAEEVAKKHIGGTFDNAHAGVWLKYFKRNVGESDEERIERFNKWLNNQALEMTKEGIVKHFHFNDTQAKDDDHNLLGSGILDIHDLRDKLRGAGVKEPLIVEAGGRGGDDILHITNAFNIFDPRLSSMEGPSYNLNSQSSSSGVSTWVETQRDYMNRPQFSSYGFSYSTFRHHNEKNNFKGGWSGINLL